MKAVVEIDMITGDWSLESVEKFKEEEKIDEYDPRLPMGNKKCISASDYVKIVAPDKKVESDMLNEISNVVKVDA